MPTYEYRCPKGHDFELFQKMSDEPRARCPECGAGEREAPVGWGRIPVQGRGILRHRLPE